MNEKIIKRMKSFKPRVFGGRTHKSRHVGLVVVLVVDLRHNDRGCVCLFGLIQLCVYQATLAKYTTKTRVNDAKQLSIVTPGLSVRLNHPPPPGPPWFHWTPHPFCSTLPTPQLRCDYANCITVA